MNVREIRNYARLVAACDNESRVAFVGADGHAIIAGTVRHIYGDGDVKTAEVRVTTEHGQEMFRTAEEWLNTDSFTILQ